VIRKTIPINNTRQREDGPVNNWESENITSKRPDYINLVRHRAKYFYQGIIFLERILFFKSADYFMGTFALSSRNAFN